MNATLELGERAVREAIRQPDALFMTFFIPLFFLVVNTGQAAEIFPPDSTGFLEGQGYGAFQLPITLLLAASFGMAALFLVEEIEGGYFDKLRAIPIPRTSIVMGRLVAEGVKGIVLAPLDDEALMAPVEEADAKGIPVVVVDSPLKDGNKAVSLVATDNEKGGQIAAQELAKLLRL